MKEIKFYTSSVYLLWFKLNMYEEFRMTNYEHAVKSNKLVLRSVAGWLRPFCRVIWK